MDLVIDQIRGRVAGDDAAEEVMDEVADIIHDSAAQAKEIMTRVHNFAQPTIVPYSLKRDKVPGNFHRGVYDFPCRKLSRNYQLTDNDKKQSCYLYLWVNFRTFCHSDAFLF